MKHVRLRIPLIAAAALAQLPACAQSAPRAVEAIALGGSQVRVYWNPAAGAAGYVITRDGVQIGSAGRDARDFTDNSAVPGRTYRYNVASLDSNGTVHSGRPYTEQAFAPLPDDTKCDVLVVGATTAGVTAAVTASRYGLDVALIEETRRLGGMPVNGLGATDMRRPEHSSGLFESFRRKVREIYGSGDGMSYEPRVAHQAIKEIVWSAPGLRVYRQVRPTRVRMRGASIATVEAEELPGGRKVVFHPKLVVDATDTGDVAAWAGAPFRVGREARSRREPHAGHIFYDRAGDRPLPGSTGRGDARVQAYAYLMTVKDFGPGADRTIPMPPGYDKNKYVHAPKWETSWAVTSGKLSNNKYEVNQHPQGSDLQEVNYRYPTASYQERRRIEKLYRDHDLGYLYYIQTEEGRKNIGLSDDDYRDSEGWPQLLYIREARRFESGRLLDETDIRDSRSVARADAIGIGDYPMDSHAAEHKSDWTTPDMGEGEFYLPQYSPWHQVPYHAMMPLGVENVFVPTAVSATHVAYGTLRLEPVRMHFGEAAGVACALCLRHNVLPRNVPVRQLQEELLKDQVVWEAKPGTAAAGIRSQDSHASGLGERSQGPGLPGGGPLEALEVSRFHASEGVGGAGPDAIPCYLYMFTDVKPGSRYYLPIQWLGARGFYPAPEPSQRTAASGQTAPPFEPDASLTVAEAVRLLAVLDRRATEDAATGIWPDVPRNRQALNTTDGSILTRGNAANLLASYMQWRVPSGASHYDDLPAGSAAYNSAEALYATSIDSRLWDPMPSYAPTGKLLFHPDAPLTRAQFAQMLYFADAHTGPLWEDHQTDKAPIPLTAVK